MTLKPYCQEWTGNPAERKEKKTNRKISQLNVRDQMDLADIYRIFPKITEYIQIDKCVKDKNLMLISIEERKFLTKTQHPFHSEIARGIQIRGNIPQNIKIHK